ncbi:glycosyltransferase family 2 protein [Phascolarctobacterium sp.]
MEKLISIVVCVYNAEKYIHKCLTSLVQQTYKNIEIIIIDDGSPDNCSVICDKYAAKDSRIKVIHQKNAGYGAARNKGISMATGEFIGFVDPDDWVDVNMIDGMVSALNYNDADIVICDWQTFSNDDEQNGELHTQNINNNWPFEKIRDEFLLDNYPNFLCNKLFALRLFAGLEIPPDIVLGDLYVCAELFVRSSKIFYVPKGYYCYRIHASFASTQQKTRRKYGMFMAWREHERVCEKYKCPPLEYSRARAQKAAISLLVINEAKPYLNRAQLEDVKKYLEKSENNKVKLPLKHMFQWWVLKNVPGLCKALGKISIYFDEIKQKRLRN